MEFRGQKTSLSAAASELLRKNGRQSTQVQGSLYWLYEGKTLLKRRQKFAVKVTNYLELLFSG